MGRFDDQVVFITGAAQGHGRAHALAFAQEGTHVALFDLASSSGPSPGATRRNRRSWMRSSTRSRRSAGGAW